MADSAETGPRQPGSAEPRQHRVRRRQPKRSSDPDPIADLKQAPSPSSVHPKAVSSTPPTSSAGSAPPSTTGTPDRSRVRSKVPPPIELDGAHQSGGRDAERGIRALIGAGPTQIAPDVAMRVRDASRPTDEDLAQAERETQIVRRNWQPRT